VGGCVAAGHGGERVGGDHEGHHADDDAQRFLTHAATSSCQRREPSRRRRSTRDVPHATNSSGTPTRLPHFSAARVKSDSKTSGGGVRFFARIPISASSCASQSTALAANARFCGFACANRSWRKSASPTTTRRPPAAGPPSL